MVIEEIDKHQDAMNKKEAIPVIITSTVLLIYTLLVFLGGPAKIIESIFIASPILVIWMVLSVIRFGEYRGRELEDNEEWGYLDKNKTAETF